MFKLSRHTIRFVLDRCFIKQPRLRQYITRLLEGDRNLDVSILGASVNINSVKEHGYLRASRLIARSSLLEDELPILMDMASLLKPGDTFVDIGANVGIYSLALARLGPLSEVRNYYAFEANPDTFRRLKQGADKLGINSYNLAISNSEGSLDFVGGAVSHVFTTLDKANSYSICDTVVRVPCRRLDSIDLQGDSLVIKIDVEGQEWEVLDGASRLFDANRIKAVYIDGHNSPNIHTYLTEKGFTLKDGRSLQLATAESFSLLALKS